MSLKTIIGHKLDREYDNKFRECVNEMFEMFRENKTRLDFNLDQIFHHFNKISHLLFWPIYSETSKNYEELNEDGDSVNFFKDDVFRLFPNITEINVYTSDKEGKIQYPMDVGGLLFEIKK